MADEYGSDHAHEGGTGITNFPRWQFGLFRDAIAQHGDKAFYIGKPLSPSGCDLALRRHRGFEGADMQGFWETFDHLKAAYRADYELAGTRN